MNECEGRVGVLADGQSGDVEVHSPHWVLLVRGVASYGGGAIVNPLPIARTRER